MSKPAVAGRGRARVPAAKIKSFLHHLAQTGSVSLAAARAEIRRSTLYLMRQSDEAFAERWDQALDMGVERLQDTAMNRAMHGSPRPVWRNGKKVGTVQHYDNRLLQFLLRAHRPDTYGDKSRPTLPPLPFDLAKRLAAARPRAEAYDAEKRRREEEEAKAERARAEALKTDRAEDESQDP